MVKAATGEEVSAEDLAAMENLLIITSTYGEGDPPDNAQSLHEALMAEGAPASRCSSAGRPTSARTEAGRAPRGRCQSERRLPETSRCFAP